MENKYLDTNTKFNEYTFDKEELFYSIEELLKSNKFPIDDFKGNIYYSEYKSMSDWDEDEFQVDCVFSWIFYPEDLPRTKFKKVSQQIENLCKEQFNINNDYDVSCIRYNDSEYSEHGYDVELKLRISYGLGEKKEG